jgi:hypothetical protein
MEHYEDYIGVPMDEFEYVLDDLSTFRAGLLTDEACDRVLDYANKQYDKSRAEEVKPREYHRGETLIGTMLPGTVGYGEGNCMQRVWGITDQRRLRGLFADIASACGIIPSTATYRILQQMPGQTVPWHVDSMQAWRDEFEAFEPHLVGWYERKVRQLTPEECQRETKVHAGPYAYKRFGRVIVCLEKSQPGHLIQYGSRQITEWWSGHVMDAPPAVWHCTTNFGIVPRWSMTVTGVFE